MGKKAVQNYLNRELDDWDWLKELSRDEVSNEIKHYFPNFNPDIAFAHQLPCVLAGILNSEFNFFLDMGLGKTFVILNLIKYWRRKYFKKNKAIVLVPNEINVYTWLDEIKKFTSFKGVPVVGSTKKKVEILNSEGHIFICNYLGFLHIFTKRVKGKGRGKDKSVIDNEKVKTILKDYRFLICEFHHRLGNDNPLR